MYEVNENTRSIKEKSGGAEYEFFILCPYDRLEILTSLKQERRKKFIANLDASDIKGEQRFAELEAFDDRWQDESEFIKWVNSAQSDVEIAERSLRMDDKEAVKKIVRGLSIPAAHLLAFKAALTGLQVFSKDADAPAATDASPEGGSAPANPPGPPLTYGT